MNSSCSFASFILKSFDKHPILVILMEMSCLHLPGQVPFASAFGAAARMQDIKYS